MIKPTNIIIFVLLVIFALLILTGCATPRPKPCEICAEYCAKFTDCTEFRAWHHPTVYPGNINPYSGKPLD